MIEYTNMLPLALLVLFSSSVLSFSLTTQFELFNFQKEGTKYI